MSKLKIFLILSGYQLTWFMCVFGELIYDSFLLGVICGLIFLFIGMTFVKAGYIVAEFMHLAHEQKSLMWTILIPCVFVVWLLGALFIQADAIYQAIYN